MDINGGIKMDLKVSCIYLTRACPMKCDYCAIRNSPCGKEQTVEEWKDTFRTLRNLGVDFHLILGNEAMLFEELPELVRWLKDEDIAYALYSTCPPEQYNKLKYELIDAGLKNLSSGFDSLDRTDSIGIKSIRGLKCLTEMKTLIPDLDTQLTITMSKANLEQVPDLLYKATEYGHWVAVNVIHWNKDGGFDFFPTKEHMEEFLIDDVELFNETCDKMKQMVVDGEVKCQNMPEYFDALKEHGLACDWHCSRPCIYTVDADGSMRVCGYRKGIRVTNYNIKDLQDPDKLEQYKKDWKCDSDDCPGCFWSYYWFAENFIDTNDVEYGSKILKDHASRNWKEEDNA
jgi:MoaA/NifB/PqqE/SkfB family radical SAM enzyme